MQEATATKWRKSSYSINGTGQCVELARLEVGIGLRDSKNPDQGHLTLTREALRGLLEAARRH